MAEQADTHAERRAPKTLEALYVTRFEVEARAEFETESAVEQELVLRRGLQPGVATPQGQPWSFHLELTSAPNSGPYRFLIHLFAQVLTSSDLDLALDDLANELMSELIPRLTTIASEQLFAATVRGPWGPMSLPVYSGTQAVRRLPEGAREAIETLAALLKTDGPMAREVLARKIGNLFEDAFAMAMLQGLIEERDSLIQLRGVAAGDTAEPTDD